MTLALLPFAERVDVVGVTPLPGAGVDRDRVPGVVTRVGGAEIAERGASSFADALHERLGAVTLEGTTTNLFQPTLRFRGFTASPLLGLPQGIAVYQNGVRINEPFGDTVQFDLLPQFAIEQAQLSAGVDPAYGLNAMGGALAGPAQGRVHPHQLPRRVLRRRVRAHASSRSPTSPRTGWRSSRAGRASPRPTSGRCR